MIIDLAYTVEFCSIDYLELLFVRIIKGVGVFSSKIEYYLFVFSRDIGFYLIYIKPY